MAEAVARQTPRSALPLSQDARFEIRSDASFRPAPRAVGAVVMPAAPAKALPASDPALRPASRPAAVSEPRPAAVSEAGPAVFPVPGPAVVPAARPAVVPAGCQRFLAFDFGLKRTGVASGNRLTRTATPQASIHAAGAARLAQVALRLREWQPDALVVGVPFHPDGAPHENTARAQKFARQLRGRFGLPVFEVDERYSTTEAQALGATDADAASACIILEQFLRALP